MNDLLHPDRVLIGSSPTPAGALAAEALANVYAAWVPRSNILTVNIWSSELSKLVANAMLAQRVSSINSVSAICEQTGADVDEVALSIGLDPRIGSKFLKAGLGFGGSCFKKDILSLVYLAESLGLDEVAEYWQGVVKINDFQRTRFAKRVIKCLNGTLVGKDLAVLGYAFKKNTNDTRESPALETIKILLEDAPTSIRVFDPCCSPPVITAEIGRLLGSSVLKENGGSVEVVSNAYQACMNAHAVLIMTECDEFRTTTTTTASAVPGASPSMPVKGLSKPKLSDPRPFHQLSPSESELLALQRYLESVSLTPASNPLLRFQDEPVCPEGCADCKYELKTTETITAAGEQLDWPRIAYHLQQPKWVFDGRNVVDAGFMKNLGVRVEAIGKAGWGFTGF